MARVFVGAVCPVPRDAGIPVHAHGDVSRGSWAFCAEGTCMSPHACICRCRLCSSPITASRSAVSARAGGWSVLMSSGAPVRRVCLSCGTLEFQTVIGYAHLARPVVLAHARTRRTLACFFVFVVVVSAQVNRVPLRLHRRTRARSSSGQLCLHTPNETCEDKCRE